MWPFKQKTIHRTKAQLTRELLAAEGRSLDPYASEECCNCRRTFDVALIKVVEERVNSYLDVLIAGPPYPTGNVEPGLTLKQYCQDCAPEWDVSITAGGKTRHYRRTPAVLETLAEVHPAKRTS